MSVQTVTLTAIFTWIWETYGEKIVSATTERLWQEFKWENAAVEYTKKVRELYGTTRPLGKHEPVALDDVYTNVHILDRPTALQRFSIDELEKYHKTGERQNLGRAKRKRGDDVVRDKDKLFILGKPGAGKTTFLKHLVLQAINGRIDKVPIFVTLKNLADSNQGIFDFIVGEFAICSFPEARPFVERLLKSGKAIVLFDGLDEVNQANEDRAKLVTALNNFTRQYNDCQFCITCRLAATDYSFEQFTYVEMADFDKAQVRTYAHKWFADRQKRDLFLNEMEKPDNERLWELAQIPLLLTLLCLAFEETLAFAQRRVEIYEEALDALLKKWDSSRNIQRDDIYRGLSLGRKRQLLAEIAANTFDKSIYFIKEQDLEEEIVSFLGRVPTTDAEAELDGAAVRRAIASQHGIFVERARQIHSFSHLTFQEYFTAKYIVEKRDTGTLERLMAHITDDRWREVFLMTASLLYDADAFFDLFFRKLDELIRENIKALALLEWANSKANRNQKSDFKLFAVRGFYLYLAFTYALVRDLDRARDLDRVRVLALAHAVGPAFNPLSHRDHDHDRARILDHFIVIDYDDVYDYALGLDLDLVYACAGALDRARDFNHPLLDCGLDRARKLSKALRQPKLQQALNRLVLPDADAPLEKWRNYSQEIEGIMIHYRQFQVWDFSGSEAQNLADYLQVSLLLVDCLQQAIVSDRQGIENRLLLPPK